MIVNYGRTGGRRPPPDNEGLRIEDDGSFTMWRSISPAIGRFAGKLEPGELTKIKKEVQAAAATGDLTKQPARDGSAEGIDIAGARATLGSNDYAEGPWGVLIEHLRTLLGELISKPQAAVGLDVKPDGTSARLIHLGEKPLAVDLSNLSVRAVLWGPGYRKLGDWNSNEDNGSAAPSGPAQVEAAGSWSAPLPFAHGFTLGKNKVLHVYVNFAASENGVRSDVTAQHTPPIPES
jgi:hypothetical protein